MGNIKRIGVLSVHTCPLGHLGTKDTGGMNVYVRELSRELGRHGFLVDIFTRYRNCDHPCVVELGDGVRLIHLNAGESVDMSKYDLYPYMPEFAANVVHFQQSNNLKYDLIHSHYWLSVWVGEILQACWKVPHLATFHTLGRAKNLALSQEEEPELRLTTEDRVTKTVDRVIALSASEKQQLTSLYSMDERKVTVVPGGIDLELCRPMNRNDSRAALGLPNESKIVLYVGRMDPLKGIDILINAISLIPQGHRPKCLIVGGNAQDDGHVGEFRSMAEDLKVAQQIEFMGPVEHETVPLFYNAADICVVPSHYESFGLVALESLACGTPVVASQVGGLPTIVEHMVNGLLVPQPSPRSFAAALSLLLEDAVLQQRLARGAIVTANRFAWTDIRALVVDQYSKFGVCTSAG
ncbi:glycosyltransferase [Chloroflexota bacterium]